MRFRTAVALSVLSASSAAFQTPGTLNFSDVTDSRVQRKNRKGIPARSSPLLVKDLLFTVNHQGIVSCFEAKTGKLVWKERLDGNYSASPIYSNERI